MIKKKLTLVLATALLSVGVFTTPALAKDGISGGDTTSTSNTTQNTGITTATSESKTGDSSNTQNTGITTATSESKTGDSNTHQKQEAKVEQETHAAEVSSHKDALETETETEINDLLKDHPKHSVNERQKNCQAAEHGLETKFQSLSTNATSFQTKIDAALSNAITYQKDNNLTVTNFAQLVADAQAAQSKAAASVSVLSGLSPTLDCTQPTVATNVANFKVAVKQAKTDLLVYKDAVKAVLQALEAAKGGN
jgi:hypothetical protein